MKKIKRHKADISTKKLESASIRENRFKQFTAILFLGSLLAPTFITYFVFQSKSISIQEEVVESIEEGIEENELVRLKFTHEESQILLRWEHSMEFEYDHQMYDIVETEMTEDSVFYLAWWDKEETDLKKEFNDIISNLFGLKKNTLNQKIQIKLGFRSLYLTNTSNGIAAIYPEKEIGFCKPITKLSNLYYPPPSPPPRIS